MSWFAGIDLGGTNLKAVAVSDRGEVRERVSVPTRDGASGAAEWATLAREALTRFERSAPSPAAAVGVCTPGVVASDGRTILSYPARLRGIEGFHWSAALARPGDVTLLNDAHAALLGESWLGAARGRKDVVLVTLGTGVGGAILVDGRLWRGSSGRAGHLGHMSLNSEGAPSIVGMPGALELAIGECSLRERCGGRFACTAELVAAHEAGDAEASRVWLRSVRVLACGIASVINVVDPELVVIGGGIAGAGAALFEPLATELARVEWRPAGCGVPIVPAALGAWAGALGAARHAMISK